MSDTLQLEIEKLSFGGDGIARKDGLVYFIPFSAPGDILEVSVIEKKKNFARAEIKSVLRPGPSRIQAPCAYFESCGGCNWQHISYEEQLKQKQNIIQEQLGKILDIKTQILPIVASPNPLRYRNRIQLKFDGQNLGFYKRGTHQVIDIQDCLIAEEEFTQEIGRLRAELVKQKKPPIPKIEILKTQDHQIQVSFEDSPFEGLGFSQVNSSQNEALIETVLTWMKTTPTPMVYDLYAGSGNFTFPLYREFPQTSFIGVDLNTRSIQQAQTKLRSLALSPKRMLFFLADVELYLKRQSLKENSIVLLDPPRSGCSEAVIRNLASQKQIQRIFYISCNPAALARDLERLRTVGGWIAQRVQPFDMFPQTDHVETLVELKIDSV
jgi:23S rRNA (uracil1939-C5)-methyltransferase